MRNYVKVRKRQEKEFHTTTYIGRYKYLTFHRRGIVSHPLQYQLRVHITKQYHHEQPKSSRWGKEPWACKGKWRRKQPRPKTTGEISQETKQKLKVTKTESAKEQLAVSKTRTIR